MPAEWHRHPTIRLCGRNSTEADWASKYARGIRACSREVSRRTFADGLVRAGVGNGDEICDVDNCRAVAGIAVMIASAC